jgi:hypothetical protein
MKVKILKRYIEVCSEFNVSPSLQGLKVFKASINQS